MYTRSENMNLLYFAMQVFGTFYPIVMVPFESN